MGQSNLPGSRDRSVLLHRFLEVESQVAFVPTEVNLVVLNGILDGTATFMRVRAIWKSAMGNVGTKFGEKPVDIGRVHAPEFKLA